MALSTIASTITQSFEWDKTSTSLSSTFKKTWHLGFTAFGGPPAHFQIFHRRFVGDWIDEQTYQELFALSQALPGPASTKFLFNVVLLHHGWLSAAMAFLLWALPGAIGMLALGFGAQQIDETLPGPVYALLSGLNSATVGIIAVAAVQLSEKAIVDQVSRLLVLFGACAGLLYTALWYFPVIVVAGGLVTLAWDLYLGRQARLMRQRWQDRRRRQTNGQQQQELQPQPSEIERAPVGVRTPATSADEERPRTVQSTGVSVRLASILLAMFAASFIAIMVARSEAVTDSLALPLFSNMYLAGTIIFGGGPVVIPLLRDYVVAPGWVTPRDFLIGLAIIQSFPGPNFNFSVYLGALTLSSAPVLGALLAFAGIFAPGLLFAAASQGFWRKLRSKPWFVALLRGINATAVGLVFTAVYRLWEVGYLTAEAQNGISLAQEPFWVVVAVSTFASNRWFKVPVVIAIASGAVLGLVWYGITS